MERDELQREFEGVVRELGFDLVDVEQAGSKTRPLLRLRIERPGADPTQPGQGVTVDECARVSRAIEEQLDNREDLSERYVLEVSSAGVERPLVKREDWDRFKGKEVTVKTRNAVGDHGKRIEGVLQGINGDEITVVLEGKGPASFPLDDVVKANLVFKWKDRARKHE